MTSRRSGTPDGPVIPSGLRTTPSIVYTFDEAGTCTLSEGAGLEALGLAPGQLVGTDLFALYADDPALVDNLRRTLAGESFVVEVPHHGRILETSFLPLTRKDGQEGRGGLGVVTDVTEQRRLEREARERDRQTAALADLGAALAEVVVDLPRLLDTALHAATAGTASSGALWTADRQDDSLLGIAAFRTAVSPDGDELRPDAGTARPEDLRVRRRLVEVIDRARVVDLTGSPDAVDDLMGEPLLSAWLRGSGAHSLLRVPLRARGSLLGALDLVRRGDASAYTESDVDFAVDVAERVALALDNALLLRAQRAALEEMAKFKALADASSDLVAIADADDVVRYVNDRVTALAGRIEGSPMEDVLRAFTDHDGGATAAEVLASADRWQGDLSLHGLRGVSDGTVVRAEAFRISHPLTAAPLGTVWIAQDVTALRAAEQALRSANLELQRFKSLVDACPEFIAIAALDGTVLYVNPPGRAMVGLGPGVDASSTRIADYLTEDGLERSLRVEQPAVIEHGSWEGESTLRDLRGGPPIPVQIASFLIRDPETDEPFALATVQRDLSDRVAAEEALRDLAEQRRALLTRLVDAQDAERAHVAAEVHDDSVQSLAAVDLRLGLLARRVDAEAPQLREYLDPLRATVTEATDRLRTLLFDLTPVDLDHGLANALRETARGIFDGSGTEVDVVDHTHAAPAIAPLPTLRVAHRIAREALINARKHARASAVEVVLGLRDGGVEVVVRDDGVGITESDLETTAGHLGIPSMRDRAQIAGGHWSIARRPTSGTEVRLWLPTRD